MELLKCLWLHAKMRSYFKIFIRHVHIFIKITADSWSPLKTEPKDISLIYFWWKPIFRKNHGDTLDKKLQEIFWKWNISIYISVDAVFDGDHEFDIIFVEKCGQKSKNCKIRVRLGIKMQFLLFLSHFSIKIISNS
jgi:hypothetical protein